MAPRALLVSAGRPARPLSAGRRRRLPPLPQHAPRHARPTLLHGAARHALHGGLPVHAGGPGPPARRGAFCAGGSRCGDVRRRHSSWERGRGGCGCGRGSGVGGDVRWRRGRCCRRCGCGCAYSHTPRFHSSKLQRYPAHAVMTHDELSAHRLALIGNVCPQRPPRPAPPPLPPLWPPPWPPSRRTATSPRQPPPPKPAPPPPPPQPLPPPPPPPPCSAAPPAGAQPPGPHRPLRTVTPHPRRLPTKSPQSHAPPCTTHYKCRRYDSLGPGPLTRGVHMWGGASVVIPPQGSQDASSSSLSPSPYPPIPLASSKPTRSDGKASSLLSDEEIAAYQPPPPPPALYAAKAAEALSVAGLAEALPPDESGGHLQGGGGAASSSGRAAARGAEEGEARGSGGAAESEVAVPAAAASVGGGLLLPAPSMREEDFGEDGACVVCLSKPREAGFLVSALFSLLAPREGREKTIWGTLCSACCAHPRLTAVVLARPCCPLSCSTARRCTDACARLAPRSSGGPARSARSAARRSRGSSPRSFDRGRRPGATCCTHDWKRTWCAWRVSLWTTKGNKRRGALRRRARPLL